MNSSREAAVRRLRESAEAFDLLIVGGGATGAGIALDAASRGLRTALFERGAFGCGTSSRSSKLIHGGVRYLAQGRFGLVRQALSERTLLERNAPSIVRPMRFVLPGYGHIDQLKFALGLKLYDMLSDATTNEPSRRHSRSETLTAVPGLQADRLVGSVSYADASFDDARLLLCLLAAARRKGALTINHAEVSGLLTDADEQVHGIRFDDLLSGEQFAVKGKIVVNAAGPWGDQVRALDGQAAGQASIMPSQGAHIVVPARFHPGREAVVFPQTPDGRIMFAIPWFDRVLLGTTDVEVAHTPVDPKPTGQEIEDILAVAARYLEPAPGRGDILSSFAGLRPLAATPETTSSAQVSREHVIDTAASGLLSVSGGKWTTYRLIAEQVVDTAIDTGRLPPAGPCVTRELALTPKVSSDRYAHYGVDADELRRLVHEDPRLGEQLHPGLPYTGAEYVWAARAEMAENVADALAYNTRALYVDARAAQSMAGAVAALMAEVCGKDARWIEAQIEDAVRYARGFIPTQVP